MAREHYDAQREHEIVGMYPAILGMAMPMPETPRFYRPVDQRENFKMLFEGKNTVLDAAGWLFELRYLRIGAAAEP